MYRRYTRTRRKHDRRDVCTVGRGSSTGVLLQIRVKRAAMRMVKVRAIRHGRGGVMKLSSCQTRGRTARVYVCLSLNTFAETWILQ